VLDNIKALSQTVEKKVAAEEARDDLKKKVGKSGLK